MKDGPARLRELMDAPGIIPSLGAHDVFSALIIERAGLSSVFLGGFGASASLLGLPDLDFLSLGYQHEILSTRDGIGSACLNQNRVQEQSDRRRWRHKFTH